MYQQSYTEVLEDDQASARRVEYEILDRAVSLLRLAALPGSPARTGVEALDLTRRLWTAFILDLSSPGNALPTELKAKLISIGIWIMKEADAIRLQRSDNFRGIAEICAIVRDGLK